MNKDIQAYNDSQSGAENDVTSMLAYELGLTKNHSLQPPIAEAYAERGKFAYLPL